MADIKHVGRVKDSGRKCLVVFRTLPGDAYSCLVVLTENLRPDYHDPLINLVESNAGQTAHEFADVLNRNIFSNGTNMLTALHVQGMLTKMPTDQIVMTPNSSTTIVLAELNQLIAESNNMSVQDLAVKSTEKGVEVKEVGQVNDISPKTIGDQTEGELNQLLDPVEQKLQESLLNQVDAPLSDADLAKQYRSDADRLSKEAAELRRMAEELVPTKRKAPAKTTAKTTKSRSTKSTADNV